MDDDDEEPDVLGQLMEATLDERAPAGCKAAIERVGLPGDEGAARQWAFVLRIGDGTGSLSVAVTGQQAGLFMSEYCHPDDAATDPRAAAALQAALKRLHSRVGYLEMEVLVRARDQAPADVPPVCLSLVNTVLLGGPTGQAAVPATAIH